MVKNGRHSKIVIFRRKISHILFFFAFLAQNVAFGRSGVVEVHERMQGNELNLVIVPVTSLQFY